MVERRESVEEGSGHVLFVFADDLVLLCEAKEDQLLCLNEGMESFCNSSGQKVSFRKSLMMCSANIRAPEAERLSVCFGVPLKSSFGKYLRHNVISWGRNKDAQKELVEKVCSKLKGWRFKCLSHAGRLTLAQSVLTNLPVFQMQLERLPTWVHRALDRATWNCV